MKTLALIASKQWIRCSFGNEKTPIKERWVAWFPLQVLFLLHFLPFAPTQTDSSRDLSTSLRVNPIVAALYYYSNCSQRTGCLHSTKSGLKACGNLPFFSMSTSTLDSDLCQPVGDSFDRIYLRWITIPFLVHSS